MLLIQNTVLSSSTNKVA